MTPFRKLTSAETAALEALGNSAEDWSKVLVSEDFKPFQLLQSHLEGDVEIAAEARIVRSRVANYRIGTGSLVEGVTALECRRRSAIGNLRFDEHCRYGLEDFIFNAGLYARTDKVHYLPQPVYRHFESGQSTSQCQTVQALQGRIGVLDRWMAAE